MKPNGWMGGGVWAMTVLVGMGATAHYLAQAVNNAFFLRSTALSQKAHADLQEQFDRQARDLTDLAGAMGEASLIQQSHFQENAVRFLRDTPFFGAVAFLDPEFRREWVFPYSPRQAVTGKDLKTDALNTAKRARFTGQPTASAPVNLDQGGVGVLVYAPIFHGTLWGGLVEGPLEISRVALNVIEPAIGRRFDYSLIDEQQAQELYSTFPDETFAPDYDAYFTLKMADRTWWVLLHSQSPPPTLAIVAMALSLEALFGVLIFYLWRRRK